MKLAEINMVDYGSTGKIMLQIAQCARENSCEVRTFSKKWKKQTAPNKDHFYFGTTLENGLHVLLYRLIGFQGLFSYFGTKQLVRKLNEFGPDVVHLHNLHDSCICIPVLFRYLKKSNVKIVWTLHDCWPMTGQCYHFTMAKCEKWKNGCKHCPQLTAKFPVDCSAFMWKHKRVWFSDIKEMTIVTPSQWLSDIVEQSYLSSYPVQVIHNGIDLSVFHPTPSNFREKYGIAQNKFIILGVAFGWGVRKGLDCFVELSQKLDSAKYQIVLVGTDESVDKQLPSNIISVHRTHNQMELAEIYTAADLFVNPTREDNFPTTNMEAIACGTPVLTFLTGGSPESLDETCASVVACNDIKTMICEIERIRMCHPYSREACLLRASIYDGKEKNREYVDLFNQTVERR